MNEKLTVYIRKRIELKHDINEIKNDLVQAGHDIIIVEQHINHVLNHRKIKDYIKWHVKIGSDINKLKQYLVNTGYDLNIIEEHINNTLKSKKTKNHILITSIIAIAILLSFAGFYFFKIIKKQSNLYLNEEKKSDKLYKKDMVFFNKALIINDFSVCELIADSGLKAECRYRLLNASIKAANETADLCDESCRSKEILNKALITHNISFCVEIIDYAFRKVCEQNLKGE